MRSTNGQFVKGHTGNPSGRPKRADEQVLIDLWESHGQKQFSDALRSGERWALKILLDKLYSNKKETTTLEEAEPITGIEIRVIPSEETRERANVAIREFIDSRCGSADKPM